MRRTDITQWGVGHPWQNENQIEQDLLLSMAMVEIANDPLLGGELMADNLAAKLADKSFCTDIDTMVRVGSPAYDPQEAGEMVEERLLRLIL